MKKPSKEDLFKIQKQLERGGFSWSAEFIEALQLVDPRTKIEALIAIAPYVMAKMPTLKENTSPDAIDVSAPKQLAEADTDSLIRLLQSGQKTDETDNG